VSTNIIQYGITYEDLGVCYAHLQGGSLKRVTVPGDRDVLKKFTHVAREILSIRLKTAASESSLRHQSASADSVLLSADSADDEAMAASCILFLKIQEDLFLTSTKRVHLASDLGYVDEGEDALGLAFAVIVMVSRSTLISFQQLQAIVVAMENGRNVVSVTLPGFTFPAEGYYQEALPSLWPDNAGRAVTSLQSFFKLIAVDFPTHASDTVLEAQATAILERIRQQSTKDRERLSQSGVSATSSGRFSLRRLSIPDAIRRNTSMEADDSCN